MFDVCGQTLGIESVQLLSDIDDAAGIDHEIGRIKNTALGQRRGVPRLAQLVVGSAGHDANGQLIDGVVVDHGTHCAGRKNVDIKCEDGVGCYDFRLEFLVNESRRPVTYLAIFNAPNDPQSYLRGVERLGDLLGWDRAVPQITCRPVKNQFDMKNPFILGTLQAFSPVFNKSVEEQMRFYSDPSFRQKLVEELKVYLAERCEERLAEPKDDMLSDLLHSDGDREDPIQVKEVVSLLQQFLVAGNETTTNLIAAALMARVR